MWKIVAVAIVSCAIAGQALAGQKIEVTKRICSALVDHVAGPDVAYQPGVDVHGRTVKPADLGGGNSFRLPDEIVIPITIDFATRYGMENAGESTIGKVRLRGGRAYLNGKPMQGADQAAIAEACRKKYGR